MQKSTDIDDRASQGPAPTRSGDAVHLGYRPDIDGLRAVAVGAVVIFHAFPTVLPGGFVGVDVFFVISGYLIASNIFLNLQKGTFRFSDFYARRVNRIFPALVLVLASVLVAGWWLLLADEYAQLGRHVTAGAVFLSNFALWSEVVTTHPCGVSGHAGVRVARIAWRAQCPLMRPVPTMEQRSA